MTVHLKCPICGKTKLIVHPGGKAVCENCGPIIVFKRDGAIHVKSSK